VEVFGKVYLSEWLKECNIILTRSKIKMQPSLECGEIFIDHGNQ